MNLPSDSSSSSDHSGSSDEFSETSATSSGSDSMNEEDNDLNPSDNDLWFSKILYDGSNQTTGDAICDILEIYIKNRQSKKSLDDILKCAYNMLPKPNYLPRSKFLLLLKLDKLLPVNTCMAKKHRICEGCSEYLGLWSETAKMVKCSNKKCNSTHIKGTFFELNIEALIKDFFENRGLEEMIVTHNEKIDSISEDFIGDSCLAPKFKFWKENVIKNVHDLCLLWNLDGTPLSKSSGSNVWLIQAHPMNIPVEKRRGFQFVCGLYYSRRKKPCMRSFFAPFVETMQRLSTEGIEWLDKKTNSVKTSIVIAPIATCDAPARAEAQCLSYSNGEYGCFCCEQQSVSAVVGNGHNSVFLYPTDARGNIIEPKDPVEFRTAEKMYAQARRCVKEKLEHVYGVKGPSIVSLIPHFDISCGFVPDHLHIFDQGIFKTLLNCFCESKNKNEQYYINKRKRRELSKELLDIKPPNSTTRTPRSLDEKNYFKANEIEEYFIHYFPILMKDKLPKQYYDHLLLICYAMNRLMNHVIHKRELDHAEYLIDLFLKDFQKLYGEHKMTYNPHVAKHFCRYIRLYGLPWNWSTYPFEDYNGYIKSIIHGKNKLDIEIVNTLNICNGYNLLKNVMNDDSQSKNIFEESDKRYKNSLNDAETLSITRYCDTNNMDFNEISLYARVKFKDVEYTSSRYVRQFRRDNSQICWENNEKQTCFGIIQIFYKFNDKIFALVRELIPTSDQPAMSNPIIKFANMHTQIRESYCLYNVELDIIKNKLIRVKEYVCIPGYTGKK